MTRTFLSSSPETLERGRPAATDDAKLEVSVVFTTREGTAAALRTAASLAHDLDAHIRFLVYQTVPFALPLEAPPVYLGFVERRCRAMAMHCAGVSEVRVEVYLCREKPRSVLRTLQPHSLVVVGGKRSWWSSPEQKLARQLQLHGHHVIFVEQLGLPQSLPNDEEVLRRLAAQQTVPVFIGRHR